MIRNLKELRKEKGISQKQLADVVCVSQQSINKYENHNIEPDINTLVRIADYFDTSVDYLIGHSEIRRRIEPVNSYDLNEEESKLIEGYRKLSQSQKKCIRLTIETFCGK